MDGADRQERPRRRRTETRRRKRRGLRFVVAPAEKPRPQRGRACCSCSCRRNSLLGAPYRGGRRLPLQEQKVEGIGLEDQRLVDRDTAAGSVFDFFLFELSVFSVLAPPFRRSRVLLPPPPPSSLPPLSPPRRSRPPAGGRTASLCPNRSPGSGTRPSPSAREGSSASR